MAGPSLEDLVDGLMGNLNAGQQVLLEQFVQDFASEWEELSDAAVQGNLMNAEISPADFPLDDIQMQALSETFNELADVMTLELQESLEKAWAQEAAGEAVGLEWLVDMLQAWFAGWDN